MLKVLMLRTRHTTTTRTSEVGSAAVWFKTGINSRVKINGLITLQFCMRVRFLLYNVLNVLDEEKRFHAFKAIIKLNLKGRGVTYRQVSIYTVPED